MILNIKILGCHSAQRYAVRQTVLASLRVAQSDYPELGADLSELKDWMGIERYTAVLSAPSLVINEKLVCVGRFPSKQEVISWLRNAMEE